MRRADIGKENLVRDNNLFFGYSQQYILTVSQQYVLTLGILNISPFTINLG